jgi:hypothetical protein
LIYNTNIFQRRNLFFELTKLPLPPNSVVTRWGTFIKAALYYSKHFNLVKEFIKALNSKSKDILKLKKLIKDKTLLNQLYTIKEAKIIPERYFSIY